MAPSATSPPPAPTSKKEHSIPLVDFSLLLNPSTQADTSASIFHAFKTSGFLYLTNHPISAPTLSTVFKHSESFFARPQSQKDSLAWTTPESNRGYVAHGREKGSFGMSKDEVAKDRVGNPDLKESFEMGREGVPGCPNQWPGQLDAEGAEFTRVMQNMFLQCKEVHRLVMSAIAQGMGLSESFFDEYTKDGENNLRLLHYPPVKREVFLKNKGQARVGAHTDYGSITLLFQDMSGGLQVQSLMGEWLDVTPIEGTMIVNAGDLLMRWSNDEIRSTRHRVMEPPLRDQSVEEYPARYSIAYFCNPDFDKWIEALPGTWEEKGGKKYEGINSGEYLVQRLSATY